MTPGVHFNEVWVEVDVPAVGDIAEHVDGLDPREVTKVEAYPDGTFGVYIYLLASPAGPFPAENYRFSRSMTAAQRPPG